MKIHFSPKKVAILLLSFLFTMVLFLELSCTKGDKTGTKTKLASTAESKNAIVQTALAATANRPTTANEAMEQALKEHHYLCLLFYDRQDDLYQTMKETIAAFKSNSSENVKIYEALVNDLKEADVVNKFGIHRAPLPVTLMVAPNGAITGGFPQKVTPEQLTKCIVPELIMKVLKSIQSNKVALVLLQNSLTKFNRESTQAATEFASDSRLNGFVDVIKHNPNDSEIKDFLTQCRLDQKITEATAVLVVPPGQIGGVYSGKITKDNIIAGLAACTAGSGCCGPR